MAYSLQLSGWWYTYPSEKYEFVNGKDDIPYMKWKIYENIKCSKPPTSFFKIIFPNPLYSILYLPSGNWTSSYGIDGL